MKTKNRTKGAPAIKARCRECEGTGFADDAKTKFCVTCKGSGAETVDPSITEDCPECKGKGQIGEGHCENCCATGSIITSVSNK